MAAASPTQAKWRTVRRYARAGDREQTRRLLEEMAREYPEDAEVAAELSRLLNGERLHIAENAAQRHARLTYEARNVILNLTREHRPHSLCCLPTAKLQDLQRELQAALHTLRGGEHPLPHGVEALRQTLDDELKRRRQRTYRRRLSAAGIAAAVLALCTTTCICLHSRAKNIENKLQKAYAEGHWTAADLYLKAASAGIYRLMNPQLGALSAKVERWQAATQLRAREIRRQLVLYENLEATDTLTLEQRAAMQRSIRALPEPIAAPLLAYWKELCRPLQEELARQKESYLAELQEAARPLSYSADPRQDADMLRKSSQRLRSIAASFSDAQEAYELEPNLLCAVEERIAQAESWLSDTEQCQMLEAKLNAARTCERHLRALQEFHPEAYPPALALAQAAASMPDEQRTIAELRSARHGVPLRIHPDIITAMVEKGPSFSQAFPATPEQVHLMEDTFSSQTLLRRFYEVIHPTGQTYITNNRPDVTADRVSFDISELDPQRTLQHEVHQVWADPQSVLIRTIDATPLRRIENLSREKFFIRANVAEALGKLTCVRNKTCPALAKAYLYHTLLELMRLNRSQVITGQGFSPTLREDAEAFRKALSECPIQLTVTCWLKHSHEVQEAENLFERWFREHANRDYASEISHHFSRILMERPAYLGYVDAKQQAHYSRPLAPGSRVRYYSGGKLTLSPADAPLNAPDILSPIIAE